MTTNIFYKECFVDIKISSDSYKLLTTIGLLKDQELGFLFYDTCEKILLIDFLDRKLVCLGEDNYGSQKFCIDILTDEVFYTHSSYKDILFPINTSLQQFNESVIAYSEFETEVGKEDPIILIRTLKEKLLSIDQNCFNKVYNFWAFMISDMENDYDMEDGY